MTGDGAVFGWATVVSVNPLSVRRDGETAPLGVSPFSLVDTSLLAVGDRVWIQLVDRRALILGVGGGSRLPYKIASGRVDIAVPSGQTQASTTVFFPAGRFTETPNVALATRSTASTLINYSVSGISTTACTINVHRTSTATTIVEWVAVQT